MPETKERKDIIVMPFGIEIDHPRNCDILLQCIPGVRLRSAIDGTKSIVDVKTGNRMVPKSQIESLAACPKLPGMQLHVNPAELTYEVIDPLHGNKKLCQQLESFLKHNMPMSAKNIDGVPPQSGKLDKHRIKSLCREMKWLVDAEEAKRCAGVVPEMIDIEELPGKFLLNPGSRVRNTQPQFEEDFEEWIDNMNRSGG